MRFLVLGIGNILFADEGFGVHFINFIKSNFAFSHKSHLLDFIDGGTLAMQLCHVMANYDEMIVVDCLQADGGKVGDVYFFPYDAMPKSIDYSGSAHEVEMLQTLQYMELAGDLPKTHILGIIPKRIKPMSFELSNEVIKGLLPMQEALFGYLRDQGFVITKIASKDINMLAKEAYLI